MSELRKGQMVWVHSNRWTPDGWEPVKELATVLDPCVSGDPDYSGRVEIHVEGVLNRQFSPRSSLELVEEALTPDLLTAAEAVLTSTFCAHYRLISPFKELADAISAAKGGAA